MTFYICVSLYNVNEDCVEQSQLNILRRVLSDHSIFKLT